MIHQKTLRCEINLHFWFTSVNKLQDSFNEAFQKLEDLAQT